MLGTLLPMLANPETVSSFAKNGSPMLVRAAGRLLGLGEGEGVALTQGRIPWWVWTVGGLAVGVVAGVKLYQKYPDSVPEFIRGEDK